MIGSVAATSVRALDPLPRREPAPPRREHPALRPADGDRAEDVPREVAELREIEELRRRDAEVRAHEQAHRAAAGGHVLGGPTYRFEVGPDGRRYATEGEILLDASPVSGDPAATIRKMQAVRRAALAPADPSAQDRQVAARASAEIARSRAELAQERSSAYRAYGRADRPFEMGTIDRQA